MKNWNELTPEQQKTTSLLLKILGVVVLVGLVYLAMRVFI